MRITEQKRIPSHCVYGQIFDINAFLLVKLIFSTNSDSFSFKFSYP